MDKIKEFINEAILQDNVEEYLLEYFSKQNFSNYKTDESASEDQIKAIKTMFTSKKNIRKRMEDAFDYDSFCLEAFIVYYLTSEDLFLQ